MRISEAFLQSADSTVIETARIADLISGVTANTLERLWSLLDAAAETDLPSNYLSQDAVSAIQGMKG